MTCRIVLNVIARFVNKLLARSRQLRWKLTLSYTVATVGALLVVELALITVGVTFLNATFGAAPEDLVANLGAGYGPMVGPYLSQVPPNSDGVRRILSQFSENTLVSQPIRIGNLQLALNIGNSLAIYFLTADGTVVDSLPHDLLDPSDYDQPFDADTIPGLDEPLQAALTGEDQASLLTNRTRGRVVGVAPIFAQGSQRVVGALAFTTRPVLSDIWPLQDLARQIGISILFITLFAGAVGTFFGSQTARGLVSRLQQISSSVRAWSSGDFQVTFTDPTRDELSQLTTNLNRMAQQLESLVARREEISVLEERNRLARDLHDSAKQQAFAAAAQLATTRALYGHDRETAIIHLSEAERLVDQVRQELNLLIRELRPAALQGMGLANALREYAFDWSNQNGVQVDMRVRGERPAPLETEQALFRIAQEALSNIARHSRAQHAEILLAYNTETIKLSIADNGRGFDPGKQGKGLGLRSMSERVELLQGTLTVDSAPGDGTRVSVQCNG